MPKFGLIGKKLEHSFSKSYFENKWLTEGISDCAYELIELNTISEVGQLLNSTSRYLGFNVTIPYKEAILSYLDDLDPIVPEIGAVNCIKKQMGRWIGYNTDAPAFRKSLLNYLDAGFNGKALVLGNGGASKSVQWVLKNVKISFDIASQSRRGISYPDLMENWNFDWKLIINTTPLGMWPNTELCPEIPYEKLDPQSLLYDLNYNPEKSLFLTLGARQGSRIKNGMEMLNLQADYSWQYWNE